MKRIAISGLILAGCLSTDPGATAPPDDLAVVATDPSPGGALARSGEEEQGRYLLGNLVDGLAVNSRHFSVLAAASTPAGVTLSVSGSTLVAKNAAGAVLLPADMAGIEMTRPEGGQLKISSATGGLVLQYRALPTQAWGNYCDPATSTLALPTLGEWTTSGEHLLSSRITFACSLSGVIEKCHRWGYPPGTTGPGTSDWDHHQACTQMANARYCMDPTPYTRELTPIQIRDSIPGAEPANVAPNALQVAVGFLTPPDDYFFEGAWAPRRPVLCLSKLRWASRSLNWSCGLPDPRRDASARFCEDYTPEELAAHGMLLVNASKTMDMVLRRWTNPAGDSITTVRGFVSQLSGKTIPPGTGYTFVAEDGILLRNLPGSVVEGTGPGMVTKRYLQHDLATGDTVLASAVPLPGHTFDPVTDFEGYTFNTSVVGLVPFNLYKANVGNDYASGIAPPSAGYTLVGPLGYVIAP